MLDDLYCQPKEDIVMGSFIEKQHPELPIEHGPKKENSEPSRKKWEGCKGTHNFFKITTTT